MKILFIAYYFPPVGGAGVQRAQKFVQYLPGEGVHPVVITGPASLEDRWTPHDRTLIAGIPSDVPIHRVRVPIPGRPGRVRSRLETLGGLPSAFSNWWIRHATELGTRIAGNEDLIFATMSPFESGEVARRLSVGLRIPWVADLRDPWALDEMQVYPTRWHRRLEMRKMETLLASAALIIMNTPEATEALLRAFPSLRGKRVITITNGFDGEDFAGPVSVRKDSRFRIVHSGYLHTDNGLRLRQRRLLRWLGGAETGVDILTRSHTVLLEAVERLCAEDPAIREDIELVFAGQTSDRDRAWAAGSAVSSRIRFTGYLSHAGSVDLVRTADLLFLPMHNLPLGKRSSIVPGKTYEYMAAGRPVLAAVPDGDARDFLSRSGAALLCRPDDAAEMARLIRRAHAAWKDGHTLIRPDAGYIRQFERRALTRTLARALEDVVQRRATARQPLQPVSAAV